MEKYFAILASEERSNLTILKADLSLVTLTKV